MGQVAKDIQKQVGELIARGLAAGDVDAFRLVIGQLAYELDQEKTKDLDLAGVQGLVAQYVAGRIFPYDPKSAAEIVDSINRKLRNYGMSGLVLMNIDGDIDTEEGITEAFPQL